MVAQFLYWMKSLWASLPVQAPAAPVWSISGAPWVGADNPPTPPSSLAQAWHTWGPCPVAEILFWEKSLWVQPAAPNKLLLSTHSSSLTSPDCIWVMACEGPSLFPAPKCYPAPQFLWYCPAGDHCLSRGTLVVLCHLTAFLCPRWLFYLFLSRSLLA